MQDQLHLSVNHPILKNHQVNHQALLPGLAYIDLLYQIFRENGYDFSQLELRNLSIFNPLIVAQNQDVTLNVECLEVETGRWDIRVTAVQDSRCFATAEMHQVAPIIFGETLGAGETDSSTNNTIQLEDVYQQCRRHGLLHTGFMKAEGEIFSRENATVIKLSIGKDAMASASGFMFHPVLIDASAIGSSVLLATLIESEKLEDEKPLYLPLFYQSFRASSLLQQQCTTRIQASSVGRKKELSYLTLEFFDESGKKIAELNNLTTKLVREGGFKNTGAEKWGEPVREREGNLPVSTGVVSPTSAESFLRQLIAKRLNKPLETIGRGIGYYEMGLDSPMLLEMVTSIEQKVGEALTPTLLFEYTTISELAEYLTDNYALRFEAPHDARNMAINEVVHVQEGVSEQQRLETTTAGINVSQSPVMTTATNPKHKPASDYRKKERRQQETVKEDIAIIGIAGRYPDAANMSEFWHNLKQGKNCITEIPESRWDWHGLDGVRSPSGKPISRWGGFINAPECFDARFFRISPREAEFMDPQERLFLETCWEVIEDAGYTPNSLVLPSGRYQRRHVGVFVGVMHKDYSQVGAEAMFRGQSIPLSLNAAPIANRVSYFCNFHGPSMAVDTVCSSSLTAVHLAIGSILNGECEVALAGGVNLSLHPSKYVTYGLADMHSSDGVCHTFGDGGDGYVSGEGVGAILLKPVQKAIQDHDHIYAIVKGSSVNHGGAVSGFTVPSPVAQADMIAACLEKAEINPRTISYLEAHGTGTSLGDPIEIQGLIKAYQQYSTDNQFCSIGSVKSNIGHAESAAGISGLSKVVLQLYHKTLVPSLHSTRLNPYIDFAQTPFYVQQKTEEWQQPVIVENDKPVCYPRRAGISSFGATGSNVHIILEEYLPKEHQAHTAIVQEPIIQDTIVQETIVQDTIVQDTIVQKTTVHNSSVHLSKHRQFILPLSAGKASGLRTAVNNLLNVVRQSGLQSNPHSICTEADVVGCDRGENTLLNLCYTLQIGRVALAERVAFIATDIAELVHRLEMYLDKQPEPEFCFQGKVKESGDTLSLFTDDEDAQGLIQGWIEKHKVQKLADLWVKGLALDWNLLYGAIKPYRISLPTYPFDRQPYWIPMREQTVSEQLARSISNAVHPLLQRNISTLSEQRYCSVFTGEEFFIAESDAGEQRRLPTGLQLEMTRIAVEQSIGRSTAEPFFLQLSDVSWGKPVFVGAECREAPREVCIRLIPDTDHNIAFELYSQAQGSEETVDIYSQGRARQLPAPEKQWVSLEELKKSCNEHYLLADECYEALGTREVATVYKGNGQLLAKLSLPLAEEYRTNKIVLHPGMFESVLIVASNVSRHFLPINITSLQVFRESTAAMWAHIKPRENAPPNGEWAQLDVDLYDEKGLLCTRVIGFTYKVEKTDIPKARAVNEIDTLLFRPEWIEDAGWSAKSTLNHEQQFQQEYQHSEEYEQHLVILCGFDDISLDHIQNRLKGVRCLRLPSSQEDFAKRFERHASQVFAEIQGIIKKKPTRRVFVQIALLNEGENQLLTGLSGILNTARLENPKFVGQLIAFDSAAALNGIADKLDAERYNPGQQLIQYRGDNRRVFGLTEIDILATTVNKNAVSAMPWKHKGTYLITGGVGGLGWLFAHEIAQRVKRPNLILAGRSALSSDNKNRLTELQRLGARVEYRQVDVTSEQASIELVSGIQAEFGGLQGIIHGAGIIRDNYILKKTSTDFQQVLAPKVSGLVYLDLASKALNLDFFVLFSSGAGVFGNLGQADYATANAFMDAYAAYRNQLTALHQRKGRTLSINWPLWKEGGMHVDAQTEALMMQSMGMAPMTTSSGLQAFYKGLEMKDNQVLVMEGNATRIRQQIAKLTWLSTNAASSGVKTVSTPDTESLSEKTLLEKTLLEKTLSAETLFGKTLFDKTLHQLKGLFGAIIKLDPDHIAGDDLLEVYGIDSIMITQLNQKLAVVFGELSKTLFYEYQTLNALTEYLLADHAAQCREWVGGNDQDTNIAIASNAAGEYSTLTSITVGNKASQHRFLSSTFDNKADESIAVIGMSGQFPFAKNLEDYWRNLQSQRNCITEIPSSRWDWRDCFHENRETAGSLGKAYTRWGAFLDGFDQFDPLFFNMSPREAYCIDPQERLFLQEAWRAFEDAGYVASNLDNELRQKIGVYGGITKNAYTLWNSNDTELFYNTSFSSLVNRVSHHMNFQGPSVPVDSMCSSALVAMHQACEDLKQGKTRMALVGAVNLYLHPSTYVALSQGQLMSSSASSDVFGEGGNGFVPSEGVGVVVLKRQSDAERDNDNIMAVIKGSAVNHNGKTNGYGVPNPQQQSAVIQQALESANVDPRTIGYIEVAANGSEMGDAIEMTALNNVFKGMHNEANEQYRMGSVKSMLGHGESVSGMAQLFKVLLQLKHKKLCPMPLAKKQNSNINFNDLPFNIQTTAQDWPLLSIGGQPVPRRAGINSFGAGGVNAHLILEEYEASSNVLLSATSINTAVIFILSAKTGRVLSDYRSQWKTYLETHADVDLVSVAYSLQNGRESMNHRFACVIDNKDDLIKCLDLAATDYTVTGHPVTRHGTSLNVYTAKVNRQDSSGTVKKEVARHHGVQALIAERNLSELARMWVQGISIPWKNLYAGRLPMHVSQIPNYPFVQKQYWVKQDNKHVPKTQHTELPDFIPLEAGVLPKRAGKNKPVSTFIPLDSLSEALPVPSQHENNPAINTGVIPITTSAGDKSVSIEYAAVLKTIRKVLFNVLYLDDQDEVDNRTNFSEIGVNSINIVTFIQALNEELTLSLRETIVFDHQNIHDLCMYILSELTMPKELAI